MNRIEKLQKEGIRRLGTPKSGFRYVGSRGAKVGASDLDRIDALRVPPAWTDVAISPSPRAALQAVGKDAAGRWQYRYHENHVRRQEQKKYERLVHFAEALPAMRRRVTSDLAHPGLDRDRVLACILRILSSCLIRPGSQAYADEHGSYGIATLRNHHVKVSGDVVTFDFPGKSGKRQQRELRDRRVARIVRRLQRAGKKNADLFKFQTEEGKWVDVRRQHINQYIKDVMGARFSAKDFRTWAGTLICACALARAGVDSEEGKTSRKKKVVSAIKETAEKLGNTPAICRSSYIYPAVLDDFERGRVVERYFEDVEEIVQLKTHRLHPSETALLDLLRKKASAAPQSAA